MTDLRESRPMDSAMALSEGEAALLSHPDALSRYQWAQVLVARRRTDWAIRQRERLLPRRDTLGVFR